MYASCLSQYMSHLAPLYTQTILYAIRHFTSHLHLMLHVAYIFHITHHVYISYRILRVHFTLHVRFMLHITCTFHVTYYMCYVIHTHTRTHTHTHTHTHAYARTRKINTLRIRTHTRKINTLHYTYYSYYIIIYISCLIWNIEYKMSSYVTYRMNSREVLVRPTPVALRCEYRERERARARERKRVTHFSTSENHGALL